MPIALFSYLSLDLGHVMQEYSKEQKKNLCVRDYNWLSGLHCNIDAFEFTTFCFGGI